LRRSIAPALGLAALQVGVAEGRVAEDLRQLARHHRLAVARAHVRDGVEAEVLFGEVGEEVRRHVGELRQVALELLDPGAGDGELAPRHDARAPRDQAHEARVGEVEEMARHVRT
jgi:hypothetical protein